MKKLGILLFCLGLVATILTLGMDTSVEVGGGRRVHNLGLLGQQQNFLGISLVIAVIGILLIIFGAKAKNSKIGELEEIQEVTGSSDTRSCPYCAEKIKFQAIICRYCGKDVFPEDKPVSAVDTKAEAVSEKIIDQSALDKMSIQLNRIESYLMDLVCRFIAAHNILSPIQNVTRTLGGISKYTNWVGAAIVLIGIGWVFFYALIVDFSYVTQLRMPEHYKVRLRFLRILESLTIIFLGIIVLYWSSIIKKDHSTIYSATSLVKARESNSQTVLWVLWRPVDLLVLTAAVAFLGLVAHVFGNTDAAYNISVFILMMSCLLYLGRRPLIAVIYVLLSFAYLFYWYNVVDTLAYGSEVIRKLYLNDGVLINIWPYIWLLIASTAVPHFEIFRVGGLKFGGLRGDFFFGIFNHTIYFPIVSVFVFYVGFSGLIVLLGRMWQLIF
jgi:hypothetical protein